MNLEYGDELFLNPTGGMGGGDKGTEAHVTTTQTNPVVPEGMGGIADALSGISEGTLNAPVNLGPLPGLDRPKAGPLTPNPSMGNMFASAPYQMGYGGMNVGGQGRMPGRDTRMVHAPRNWGDLFAQRPLPQTSGMGQQLSNVPLPINRG